MKNIVLGVLVLFFVSHGFTARQKASKQPTCKSFSYLVLIRHHIVAWTCALRDVGFRRDFILVWTRKITDNALQFTYICKKRFLNVILINWVKAWNLNVALYHTYLWRIRTSDIFQSRRTCVKRAKFKWVNLKITALKLAYTQYISLDWVLCTRFESAVQYLCLTCAHRDIFTMLNCTNEVFISKNKRCSL